MDDTNQGGFTVYPNPAEELITIIFDDKIDLALPIEIHTSNGQFIEKVTTKSRSVEIDLSKLKSGVYIISIGEVQRRLVVK